MLLNAFGSDQRNDVDLAGIFLEFHGAVNQRVESEISAATDILARMELGSALTQNNTSGADCFAAVCLHTEKLRITVTTVSAARLTFFMCHLNTSLIC